jgi:hypothetical protein
VTDRFRPPEGGGVGLPLLEALEERKVGEVGDTSFPFCRPPDNGGDIEVVEGRS